MSALRRMMSQSGAVIGHLAEWGRKVSWDWSSYYLARWRWRDPPTSRLSVGNNRLLQQVHCRVSSSIKKNQEQLTQSAWLRPVIFFLLTGVKSSKEKEKEKEIYSTHSARIQPQIIDQVIERGQMRVVFIFFLNANGDMCFRREVDACPEGAASPAGTTVLPPVDSFFYFLF